MQKQPKTPFKSKEVEYSVLRPESNWALISLPGGKRPSKEAGSEDSCSTGWKSITKEETQCFHLVIDWKSHCLLLLSIGSMKLYTLHPMFRLNPCGGARYFEVHGEGIRRPESFFYLSQHLMSAIRFYFIWFILHWLSGKYDWVYLVMLLLRLEKMLPNPIFKKPKMNERTLWC